MLLMRRIGAPVNRVDAPRDLIVLPQPGLLQPLVSGRPLGLLDPGVAGRRATYASGRPPFWHEAAPTATASVAVALQVDAARARLLGALARAKPCQNRPRQKLIAGRSDLRAAMLFKRQRVAPWGR